MAGPIRGSVVGFQHAQCWLVGTDGYMYGTVGQSAPADSTLNPLLLAHPVTAQVPTPQRVVVPLKGGNRFLGQVMFGPDQFGSFPLTLEDLDLEFNALIGNSSVDSTTNTRWKQGHDNINLPDLPQVGLMLTTLMQSRESGSDGVNYYLN